MRFKILVRAGLFMETLIADYTPYHFQPMKKFNFYGQHHLELYGNIISSTGYQSHFFCPCLLNELPIEKYIAQFIRKKTGYPVEEILRWNDDPAKLKINSKPSGCKNTLEKCTTTIWHGDHMKI